MSEVRIYPLTQEQLDQEDDWNFQAAQEAIMILRQREALDYPENE